MCADQRSSLERLEDKRLDPIADFNEQLRREQEAAAQDEHEFGAHLGFCSYCANQGCKYCLS
jgi:hypothetical protein